MRRTTALVVLGWLALSAASVACSSSNTDVDDEGGGAGSGSSPNGGEMQAVGPSDICASLCGALAACDNGDAAACGSECEAALAATGGKLRSDFADYVERCLGARDCSSLMGGGFETCRAEAVASLAPSDTGRSFCDDLDAAIVACSAQAVPESRAPRSSQDVRR